MVDSCGPGPIRAGPHGTHSFRSSRFVRTFELSPGSLAYRLYASFSRHQRDDTKKMWTLYDIISIAR